MAGGGRGTRPGHVDREESVRIVTVTLIAGVVVWLLLSVVTLGIYTAWWQFSRIETVYRAERGWGAMLGDVSSRVRHWPLSLESLQTRTRTEG